jgi:hypothetical protein
MPFVVFYSWQSDRDPKTTRHFIREALDLAAQKLAREMEVEDVVRVDQDTQDVPGHPEIFRTICGKIDACAIFVADLTYVAKTDSGERIPNPNVAIELGYALKSIGPDRYIAVMNSEFGGPEDLPFDLRHRRWPIQYKLPSELPADEWKRRKEELAEKFARAIRTIIDSGVLNATASRNRVVEVPSTGRPALFFDETKPFAILDSPFRKALELRVPPGAKLYLRLIPTRPAAVLETADVYDIAKKSGLEPMRTPSLTYGVYWVRNEYGAAAVAIDLDSGNVYGLTQIIKRNREIWGVDALTISEEDVKKWSGVHFGYFPCSEVEEAFDTSLAHYIRVAKEHLDLSVPLRFVAGVDGVKNYRIALTSAFRERFGGRMVVDHLSYEGIVENFGVGTHELLLPFYLTIWRECGLRRPEGKI